MAKTDLVPCFLTGQDDSWQEPFHSRIRFELWAERDAGLGEFDHNGKIFRYTRAVTLELTARDDGPFGVGNMVPFVRIPSKLRAPHPLHYPIPMCGAHDRRTKVKDINYIPIPPTAALLNQAAEWGARG